MTRRISGRFGYCVPRYFWNAFAQQDERELLKRNIVKGGHGIGAGSNRKTIQFEYLFTELQ